MSRWVLSGVALAALLLVSACGDSEEGRETFPGVGWQPLPGRAVTTVAFGSCAKQQLEQPIWDRIAATRPDVYLSLGDAIYGDWDGEKVVPVTRESLIASWNQLAEKPEFRRFREQVPVMATWDNHDYGKHDGGAEFALKDVSREVFLDFFGEPAASPRRTREAVYDARILGPEGRRVQIVLLDTRSFKGPFELDTRSKAEKTAAGLSGSMGKYAPYGDPDVTLLGAAQWAWFEAQLRKPAEVRLICSSTQVVADQKGMDEWGNYPVERKRLFDLVAATEADGVVLLSGNVHFAELSRYEGGAYPLYDFTSSGLTHVEPAYAAAANPYRVAGPCTELNFGLLVIDWGAEPGPVIRLRAMQGDGTTAFEKVVPLADLARR